jgi:hypothetical protein
MQENSSTTLAVSATQVFDFGAGNVDVSLLKTGDVGISVVKLAEALGYDRQSLHDMINRDKVLRQYKVSVTLTTGKIPRQTAFLERAGVFLVCAKLSSSRIKDPIRRKALQTFQRWAAEKLSGNLFDNPEQAELGRVGAAFSQALFGNLPEKTIEAPKPVVKAPKPPSLETRRQSLVSAIEESILCTVTWDDVRAMSVTQRMTVLEILTRGNSQQAIG